VDFGAEVHIVLAEVVCDGFVFACGPGGVVIDGLADGSFFLMGGVDACGEFGEEFGSGSSDGLGADALAVSADGFPVAFVVVVGVPEAVYAVGVAGARVAFGGGAVEDAFEFGFDVFSGGCAAHGVSISSRRRVGKMLIQNLSKMKNADKFFGRNQAESLTFFHRISEVWDAMCVCKKRAESIAISGDFQKRLLPPDNDLARCMTNVKSINIFFHIAIIFFAANF
jgi:hypothetical protein